MISPYPWLSAVWHQLRLGISSGRFSHAVLLYGPGGVGKHQLARSLSALLLCERPGEEGACGACRSCAQFQESIRADREGGHPDFIELEPDDGSYPIDTIRAIGEKLMLTHHSNSRRIVLIKEAECMNTHAANALLRILEEPPPGSFFVLTADERMRIIATVRSRLIQFLCSAPPQSPAVREWVQEQIPDSDLEDSQVQLLFGLCAGAPLRIVDFVRDNKLDEVLEFYQLANTRSRVDELHVKLKPWAAKAKIQDSIDWLMYMVQAQALSLQGSAQETSPLVPMPDKWHGRDRAFELTLGKRLHKLLADIDESRTRLARKQFYSQMLERHMLEYRRLTVL